MLGTFIQLKYIGRTICICKKKNRSDYKEEQVHAYLYVHKHLTMMTTAWVYGILNDIQQKLP